MLDDTKTEASSPDLVKVGNDLVEQPQALQAFLVDVTLGVKLFKIRNRCKHHADTVVRLVVEVLQRDRHIPL